MITESTKRMVSIAAGLADIGSPKTLRDSTESITAFASAIDNPNSLLSSWVKLTALNPGRQPTMCNSMSIALIPSELAQHRAKGTHAQRAST